MQLIFFVPGHRRDPARRRQGHVIGGSGTAGRDGRVRQAAARGAEIDVSEAYFHCGKALMRSKLWSAEPRSNAR